jgi:hypothetical protein
MANRPTQGQQQPAKRNPGTYSPDEDDVERDQQSNTADQNQNINQRKGTRKDAEERVDDDSDIGDDKDEEDGSGGHI